MTRQQVLDLYFLQARHQLVDLAAFLDRVDRAAGEADFRLPALQQALAELQHPAPDRAERVLLTLSDASLEPVPAAPGKGAVGAPHPPAR